MPNKHNERTRTFAFILYPEEDKLHKFIFDYYSTREACVWITHDRDIWTDSDFQEGKCTADEVGTLKKKHMHFLVRFDNPRSTVQFQNDCTFVVPADDVPAEPVTTESEGEVPAEPEQEQNTDTPKFKKRTIHFEVITSYESMIKYFIHDTIQCVYQKKTRYNVDELQGDRDLIYKALHYEYPFIDDVYGQLVDIILSNNMQYHQFVQFIVGNFRTDTLESKCFHKYQYDFRAICESLRWDNYHKLSPLKKKALVDDIKTEFKSDDIE